MTSFAENYPTAFLEALCVHEALRTLGFAADQIFLHRNPSPSYEVVVVLRHCGKQLATISGPYEPDDWADQWKRIGDDFNSGKIVEDDFQDWYRNESWIFRNKAGLLLMLHSKGIEPPYSQE